MQIEKRLSNHYKRWSIELDYDQEYLKFKNRLVDVLNRLLGDYITTNKNVDQAFFEIVSLDEASEPYVEKSRPIYKKYNDSTFIAAQLTSIIDSLPEEIKPREIEAYTDRGFGDTEVYQHISDCESLRELANAIQFLFWSLEERYDDVQSQLLEFVKEIRRISILTPSVSFSIYRRGRRFTVYPNGDPFLDQGIIEFSLSRLEKYPKAAKYFEKALSIHQRNERDNYRELLDNLRFSLEQFLKDVLNNKKSLENQKGQLLSWLKSNGLHTHTVNLYETLLKRYCSYQNDAVKHQEDFSIDEVEFMIYLTGNFMRLILQLSSKEETS